MAKFAYNIVKNASIGHTSFKLSSGVHLCVSYDKKEILNPHSKSKSAEKLSFKLRKLIIVYQQNLHHAQNLQKQAYNKSVKPQSYAQGDKV